jgi:Flp pilus assembly protein TadG
MRLRRQVRSGGSLLELALTGSFTFLLLLGLLVGGLGVFRYQQVARLARDATRYASVHGTLYAQTTGNTAASSTDVYNNAIVPNAQGLTLSKLTYSVSWSTSNSPYHTATVSGSQVNVANTVTVTINYNWIPEAFLGGITLTSTSTCVMSF